MKYLAIIMLVMSGCGKATYIDPQLLPYVEEFKVDSGGKGLFPEGLVIKVGDVDFTNIGECEFGDPWTIIIDLSFILSSKTTSDDVRAVVYHELTHCALDKHYHSLDRNSYFFSAGARPPRSELAKQLKQYL